MDPITQGVLGASLSQSVSKRKNLVIAGFFGLVAGMIPDLDVFIRSQSDPLLFLEYHRQFSHSLFFIPLGSFICALVLHQLFGKQRGLSFRRSWLYCALGYGTHGILDACTSYGTQLLWPISDKRYAWNTISVIDPVFSLPIIAMVVFSMIKRNRWVARLAILWSVTYLGVGAIQKERAETVGWELAKERQHLPIQLEAKPSFANILLWKVIYETNDHYHVDAVRLGTSVKTFPGESIAKLNTERDFPWLNVRSQQANDIERFRRFSRGFLAQDPIDEFRIIDVRYSILPNQFKALWSIQLDPLATAETHAEYTEHRDNSLVSRETFIGMLFHGRGPSP
ncbi:metal-dependent hydrolase [Vibrio sp. ZSDE26]|uniref:Metal-dependent hydrolase n=1 Tax=Vibrio amylolyticus TaxID=2847292 RepID=A0A9X1XLG9_9VIBR|nr:metal-dependent hydrolase [Vibrio amylolyticus]MCK6264916.1 metal-dependent hydrolase [Vibrio amylolyticus]